MLRLLWADLVKKSFLYTNPERGAFLTFAGVGCGLLIAVAFTRVMASMLYGIRAIRSDNVYRRWPVLRCWPVMFRHGGRSKSTPWWLCCMS